MRPLNIALRLAAAFFLLAAVLGGVGWQGISHLRQLDAQMKNIIRDRWQEQLLSYQAYRLSAENGQLTWLIFLLDDPDKIQQSLVQRDANYLRITELIHLIEPRLDAGKEKQLFAAVQATRPPYIESYQRALSLLLTEHKRDEARQMMVDVVRPRLTAYHQAWGAFNQFQVDEINAAMRQSQAEFAVGQRNFLLVLTVAGLIVGAIAIFTVVRLGRETAISQRAKQSLEQARDELEMRVVERTAELATANELLHAEITERKLAENTLRASNEKFQQLVDNITDVFWIRSPDMREVRYLSPGFEGIWGRSATSLCANPQSWTDYILPDDRERVRGAFTALTGDAASLEIEYRIVRPDGEIRWVRVRGFQVRDQAGTLLSLTGIITDITERKRLELQLFQSQKMETVGKLAGGIAHEFNSILTAIIGQSELLLADLPAGGAQAKSAAEIRKAADRAAILTRQLLAYGRKQILQPEILDLNALLAGMAGTLRHLFGRGTDMCIAPAAERKTVKADAGQIEQVILNLALNANDAMPNGGKLALETANVSFDQDSVGGHPDMKAGDYVMLAISDTGRGMSETVKARAFEPFFTTKGVGEGTGLGLSICYGIIKQSGGHISVYSEPGRGTTFKIYLPQVAESAGIPVQRLDAPDLPRGTETVLLVEDDPALREMAASLLRRLGYTVLTAANGIEALSLCHERETGRIDLLFTDVVMPHMSGRELADRMRALYPRTRILFTSAYTETAIAHQGVLNQGVVLLQKPFSPSALAQRLREVLDQVPLNRGY
jgi:PAS domain S-box-containing protein